MKVYLDDERHTPDGWTRVYWPDEAVALLATGQVVQISLDHDLGDDRRGTGYDVVLWIEEAVALRGFVPPLMYVHSANSSAREKMDAGIAAIGRLALIRTNPLGTWVYRGAETMVANHIPFLLDDGAGTLVGHVSRANPVWRQLDAGVPSLVTFHGPQGYITPDYIDRMQRAIVGIEISIVRIDGKLKASQDEDRQDRYGTVQGMQQSGRPGAQDVAGMVRQALEREG